MAVSFPIARLNDYDPQELARGPDVQADFNQLVNAANDLNTNKLGGAGGTGNNMTFTGTTTISGNLNISAATNITNDVDILANTLTVYDVDAGTIEADSVDVVGETRSGEKLTVTTGGIEVQGGGTLAFISNSAITSPNWGFSSGGDGTMESLNVKQGVVLNDDDLDATSVYGLDIRGDGYMGTGSTFLFDAGSTVTLDGTVNFGGSVDFGGSMVVDSIGESTPAHEVEFPDGIKADSISKFNTTLSLVDPTITGTLKVDTIAKSTIAGIAFSDEIQSDFTVNSSYSLNATVATIPTINFGHNGKLYESGSGEDGLNLGQHDSGTDPTVTFRGIDSGGVINIPQSGDTLQITHGAGTFVSFQYGGVIDIISSAIEASNLPTSAPGTSGRLWVDTTASNVIKRVP